MRDSKLKFRNGKELREFYENGPMAQLDINNSMCQHRLKIFEPALELKSGDVFLDIGCGSGIYALYFANNTKNIFCVGLDFSLNALKYMSEFLKHNKLHTKGHAFPILGDVNQLPIASESVDKILMNDLLEHIPDYEKAISEASRVLKPDGITVVYTEVYCRFSYRWLKSKLFARTKYARTKGFTDHDLRGGHLHIFKVHELKKVFIKYNFEILDTVYDKHLIYPLILDFHSLVGSVRERFHSLLRKSKKRKKSRHERMNIRFESKKRD